eukprot:m.38929 g.38929  ORF g.38929 m.38929 type:complete len:354 (-) comp10263_c0_seq2:2374-3435(-)
MAARYTRPTLPEVCQAQQLRVQIHKALVHALSNRKHRITGQDRAQASPSETAQSATTTATHLLSSVLEVALDTLCYQQSGGSFVESIFALTRVHTPFIASHDHKNNQDGDKPCAPTPHFGTSLLSSRKLLSSVIAQVLAVVETRESSLPSAAALALTLVKLTEWALLLLFTLGIAPTFTLDAWLLNLAIAPLMSQTPHLAIKRRQLYFLASKLPLIRRIFMKTGETLASVAGTLSLLLPMAIWAMNQLKSAGASAMSTTSVHLVQQVPAPSLLPSNTTCSTPGMRSHEGLVGVQQTCPLCNGPVETPATLPSSGVLSCAQCLHAAIAKHSRDPFCPLVPATIDDVITIYWPAS